MLSPSGATIASAIVFTALSAAVYKYKGANILIGELLKATPKGCHNGIHQLGGNTPP